MRDSFDALAAAVCVRSPGADLVSLAFAAEASDFIRFNHGKVRQAMHVEQRNASVSVVRGGRRATGAVTLSGDAKADIVALRAERDALVERLPL
ncbi:MAG: TldD/PmbA family protein, partial [Variovorax sp.]